ncbi:MAG TPA: 50S ribosomal protein L5 [Candidatus Aerophobetes bacterium]|uniref:Large ribosomal subunit protein uL5 n=1 Tax=Aerophobetes bacterium TaxID=2030807 RepID=A0A7V5HZY3_UNCAE|nr:50S ribosomal protein L5 [Candidatus Aerophobetes bacterium]
MARLKELYKKEIVPQLMKELGFDNPMRVPRIEKVCVNIGLGKAKTDPSLIDLAKKSLSLITGQAPVVTKAKKSIAGFNLRKGMTIGCKVTLRGERMYEFLDRLFNLAMPRIRDFQGVSERCFDGRGNFTLGLRDQMIFPEAEFDIVSKLPGISVTIVTTADNDMEAKKLLEKMGMPFRRK